ncbi:tRNA (N(6)-L-threonylcarbamoyladenosine(37)-C(2))-methylthiotransferase MtaB [Pseudodesulfovibrio sp. zrk46]|uniref:tRNA (N(6)-L-threonylcarbamoyladenosine(37)-C(2))- methylthiotransferase MtaB n=1 Tax=Pseudodesulfovibrio sp. zrk46 TaxID=2725288 RepID=UPI001449C617|nr:tRNA (N(6)-L-threonylcarbamoyladenosine(37)-C(2))-methylthiotransferase MtaB [Pseudodesulfovibrio sp. zrk46]QJB54969.1 tRNA (N(6)-L-threonylcarbamoyladenosine(37)-C(2))-methylthiotransferase MtaB [Pseudodesulfovibrio sp. zrk46]
MIRFFTATLGCKINQYETQAIGEAWARDGGQEAVEVKSVQEANLILVNSCAVTANAVADLRQAVRRYHRDNPDAEIIITGCAAQIQPKELAELPGVVRVVPQDEKAKLLEGPESDDTPETEGKDDKPAFAPFSISGYGRARAVVKVQDGCSHNCTYCIIPLTRGKSISRPMDEVVEEVGRLLAAGFREFILSGINLRHFGRGLTEKVDFWDLVQRLESEFSLGWAGRARFRISSVEPGQLDDKAFETLAASRMVCPQLHLSLQSGDPDVLRAMGRGHYSPENAVSFMERLSTIWPTIGLGADIITGFPGETEEQFENTMDLCRRLPLTYGHVFPYSERPGTRAETLKNVVSVPVRKERAARLRKLVNEKKKAFQAELLKRDSIDVLVQDEVGRGVSEFYAACRFDSLPDGADPRMIVRAKPVGQEKGVILVEPLEVMR